MLKNSYKPSPIAPPTEDQNLKYLSLWGSFLIKQLLDVNQMFAKGLVPETYKEFMEVNSRNEFSKACNKNSSRRWIFLRRHMEMCVQYH